MKRVVVMGSGLVSRPLVRYFLERSDCRVTVGSLSKEDAEALVLGHPRAIARQVDVTDPAQAEPLIRDADLLISLVPSDHHAALARLAIRHRVNMVTTSYVSTEMRSLDAAAQDAGVTIVNEVGLDPGIDHMSSARMIQRAKAAGGRVISFESCCGSLPSPDAADNPWRYRFAWSPRGVLVAGRQPARYLADGNVVQVAPAELFRHARTCEIEGVGAFEIYPNRDSLPYAEAYGIPEATTFLRGTLRYPGWCETMQALVDLGLLDTAQRTWPVGTTYADVLGELLPQAGATLAERLSLKLGIATEHPIVKRLEWAGLLSGEPLRVTRSSPLDALADLLQRRMAYGAGARDMVILRHEMRVGLDQGVRRDVSLLVAFGVPHGESATARTVSLPAAVAGDLLLEGRRWPAGVLIPTSEDVYGPILTRLEAQGITLREWSEPAS